MKHNDCFGHNNCNNPIVFTPDCCNNPQTVPITSEQLGRLITLLNSLIAAIAAFLRIKWRKQIGFTQFVYSTIELTKWISTFSRREFLKTINSKYY